MLLSSDVETKLDHVAVLHDVILSFDSQFAGFARLGEGAERDEIVEVDGFRGDEAALEIGMDHACGGRCLVAARMVQARVSFSPVVR